MAARWSSEHVVAEYRELQASSMAVDCTGQYALLAGRRSIALIDLDDPHQCVKRHPRQSKWEVSVVQWNPHNSHANIFVAACNQRADLCSWADSSISPQGTLKAHTRVISDLDWSPAEPTTIATCSVDTYTYLWDTRDTRKPTVSLQAVAGASQVKWNRVNSNLLATTHDGDIRIWDPRKSTSPVQYIAGHLSKIHGLDWSPSSDYHLVTSSQDCSVKFWNVTNPRQPEEKLPSAAPVWRARYTPFGQGLITVVVPQLRRGENSLFLWWLSNLRQPIHTFVGHNDVVLEFQWRKQREGSSDYQLVTWSKDQSLRIWRIEPHLQRSCGHEIDDRASLDSMLINEPTTPASPDQHTMEHPLVSASKMAHAIPAVSPIPEEPELDKDGIRAVGTPPQPIRRPDEMPSPQQPKSLQHEFSLVNLNINNLTVDEMDAMNRKCTVSAISGKHVVKLTMSFPEMYPYNVLPQFQFGQPLSLDKAAQTRLIKVLRDTSLQYVKHNRSCLEPCLRQLVSCLDSITSEERQTPDSDTPYGLPQQQTVMPPRGFPHPAIYSYDASVPFPRTSGARFCGAGLLICFTRRIVGSRRTSSNNDLTPRALSALGAYATAGRTPQGSAGYILFNIARSPPQTDGIAALNNYYQFKDRKPQRIRKQGKKDSTEPQKDRSSSPKKIVKVGPIVLYDVSCLLPVSKQLAENYIVDCEDVEETCKKNAAVAAAAGRKDLCQVWNVAALARSPALAPDIDPDIGPPWAFHPFGRKMVKSLIDHYSSIYDVQTLAMLCCAFGSKTDVQKPPPSPAVCKSTSDYAVPHTYNPYHTIHPSDTSLKGWNITAVKVKRSNSCSDIFDGYSFTEDMQDSAEIEREQHERNSRLLDWSCSAQYDYFKKAYADILYRWGLQQKRAEVLKFVSTMPEAHKGIEFVSVCQHCKKEARGVQCWHCKNLLFQCSICHISVKGSSSFCLICGHGGHSSHMMEWFSTHEVCPTGCGCVCLTDNPMVANEKEYLMREF